MQIIDGKLVASQVLEEVKGDIDRLKAAGITPGLAVVLVLAMFEKRFGFRFEVAETLE